MSDLFMNSLYEAIILVVIVSLIGFWDWRSALLMGLAIPITLFITFGMAHMLGIDLQQVSIATLIIALGLLVDVPVVAGDAIKNQLGAGLPPLTAAWVGPTKLIVAIIFATITNIVAYSAVPDPAWRHGRILIQPAHRADLLFSGGVDRGDDLHPLPRLLFVEAQNRTATGRTAQTRASRPSITESANGRSTTVGWCCSARSSYWRVADLLAAGSKPTFSRKTFPTFHTSTCGCPKMRLYPRPTKPRGTPRKWCARWPKNTARSTLKKMASRVKS
jgi:hypothetical protein